MRRQLRERLRTAALASDSLYAVQAAVEREAAHFAMQLTLRKGEREVQRRLVAPTCQELVEALVWLVAIGADRAQSSAEQTTAGQGDAPAVAPSEGVERTAQSVGAGLQQRSSDDTTAPPSPGPRATSSQDAKPSTGAEKPPLRSDEPRPPPPAASRVEIGAAPARGAKPVRRRRSLWYRVSIGAGAWSDRLPKPQPQLSIAAGVGLGPLFFELRFAHLFSASQGFGDERSVSIRSEALTAAGCSLFRLGQRGRLGPCLQLTGMRSVAAAHGTSNPERGSFTWLVGAAAAQAAVTLRAPFALIAELGLGIPLGPRPGFSVAGHGEVARASRLIEQGSLGIGAHW